MARAATTAELLQISVRGVVQGVGFRPFVYQLTPSFLIRLLINHCTTTFLASALVK